MQDFVAKTFIAFMLPFDSKFNIICEIHILINENMTKGKNVEHWLGNQLAAMHLYSVRVR